MKLVSRALLSARHLPILLIAVWSAPVLFAGEALDLWTMDYRLIVFAITVGYWVGVAFEIAVLWPRRERRSRHVKKGRRRDRQPPFSQ